MDSLTHIAIGACLGEVFAGKKLGKKALVIGAALQSFPDIDFIASFFLDPVEDIVAHRGITHSLLFAALSFPLLAVGLKKLFPHAQISLTRWLWFCGAEILVHLFLDAFNAYGTGWFEPFSQVRVSFNSVFVADPLFSIFPIIAFGILLLTPRDNRNRLRWVKIGLGAVCVYLCFTVVSKILVYREVEHIAASKQIRYDRFFTTPTPLNSLLWFVVLQNDSGFHVGYRSLLDRNSTMHFQYFPKNEFLLTNFENSKSVDLLKRFSQGYYVVQEWGDTLVFSDLRFGQMAGWYYPENRFAFYYYLTEENNNDLIIQRGRFQHWNKDVLLAFWRRIRGMPVKIKSPA